MLALYCRNLLASAFSFLPCLLHQRYTNRNLLAVIFRIIASNLSPRVQEILNRGGVSVRTLRTQKERVRDALRRCVDQGSRLPSAGAGGGGAGKGKVVSWEREAAVMVGAVMGVLGR